jgi:uncharacterized NAD-dependent epimerase/dehydratase family protein
MRRHREVEDPWPAAVATDPELAAIGQQVVGTGQRSKRPARVGPDTDGGREVVEHRAKVGPKEADIDVVLFPRATRERIDRPATDDPPRHGDTVEERTDLGRGEWLPRPVPALERLVIVAEGAHTVHVAHRRIPASGESVTLGPMRPTDHRRLVILAEGEFTPHSGKTAFGVIRYGRDEVVAVIDSTKAGQSVDASLTAHDIPIVATLDDALATSDRPDALLIGIAPTGGRLPDDWRKVILAAIEAGLDVLSGLHTFLGDDPEFRAAAEARGTQIVDYRRPPDRFETAVGRRHRPGKRVILTVGSDCAIGKMSVALELRRAALAAGDRASFVPTGQTGMMIEGWGVAVDRLISDFAQGTIEWLVEQGEELGDWVLVEGQGSLDHPAYSSVTLALIHGATPQAMVMVHKPGLAEHDFVHLPEASFPIAQLPGFISLHEQVAGLVAPSKVVAVALNTSLYSDADEARAIIAATSSETGLPADDPFRFGPDRLWAAIREGVDALPWVGSA